MKLQQQCYVSSTCPARKFSECMALPGWVPTTQGADQWGVEPKLAKQCAYHEGCLRRSWHRCCHAKHV